MPIIDEGKLLTDEELKTYNQLLQLHSYKPYHFLVEVTEDQDPMDMNDIDYVIILKIKVTHVQNDISNTYLSRLDSGTWLSELENDFKNNYYS
jgi:hypothetical protein